MFKCFLCEKETNRQARLNDKGEIDSKMPFRYVCKECDPHIVNNNQNGDVPDIPKAPCFKCGEITTRMARVEDNGKKIDLNLPFRPICNECGPNYKILGKIEKPHAKEYRGGRTEVFQAPELVEDAPSDRPQAFYSPEDKIFYKIEDGKKIPLGSWGEFAQELSDSNPAADPLDYSDEENDFSRLHQTIADSRAKRMKEIDAEKILDKTMRIDRLAITQWDWVVSMGWHNKTPLECLGLIASEAGEAMNAFRDHGIGEELHGELIDILLRTLDFLQDTHADIIAEVQKRMKRNRERGTRGREK